MENYYTAPASVQPKDISDREYQIFERHLEKIIEMKKRGRQKRVITPEEEVWLKAHYNNYTRKQISKKLNVSLKVLKGWLSELRIEKKNGPIRVSAPMPAPTKANPKPPKEIIKYEPKVYVRPRAEYSNPSREQHIDRILNMPL